MRKNLTFSETIKRIPTNVLEVIVLAMLLLLSIFYSLDKKEILAALPTLMLFTLSGVKLNSLVSSFAANVSSIWALLPSVEQLAYELRQGTSIAELETLHSSNKEEKISPINTISATQLGFSYDGERSILKNCDFELSSPSCLAIYGPSGSGKSTLGLILTNFMRPTSGRVLVNGRDMNSVAKKSLNQKLGYVSPNDYFFEDSIINNLRIVAPDVSREYVLQLADELNLTEWLSSLDDGLDTIIGSQGLNISSGQQARLSVLRAALRKHISCSPG